MHHLFAAGELGKVMDAVVFEVFDVKLHGTGAIAFFFDVLNLLTFLALITAFFTLFFLILVLLIPLCVFIFSLFFTIAVLLILSVPHCLLSRIDEFLIVFIDLICALLRLSSLHH